MSTHKPSMQQKVLLEARVLETLNHCFPEFKCSITDIKFPKSEFVINFYKFILEELRFDVSKLMMGPLEDQLQGESHPELYLKSLPLVNMARALRTILIRLLGADRLQFGLEDLLEPNPSRNSLFMFNLLNFYSFADTRLPELSSKLEVIGQSKAEAEELLRKREMISRGINQRALTKGKRADYAREIKSKKLEIDELQKESKSVEQLSEKKLAELEEAKKKLGRVQSDVSQLNETFIKLEAQQVQSPDVIKSNFKNMQAKLEETKQQLEQAQQTLKERKKAIALFETVEKGQDTRFGLVTDAVSIARTIKDLEKQLADGQRKLKSELEEISKCQANLKELMRESTDLSHQLTNTQLKWESKKRSMEEEIRFLKEDKNRLKNKESKDMEKICQEICQVQAEIKELIEKNNAFNEMCEKKYAELMEMEQEFIAEKNAAIEADIEGLNKLKRAQGRN
ncbi:synaptonemal complex protein 1-like [Thrips palmi]|uniref:Synaptonemal complex protein 1-like n=1 Tax=Thrips palmi TaxID=161013 RepID=A0A6P8ZWS3_THRPL|nr:synaptonemal complex protein 1-like [Thrips palmi]